MPVRRYAVCDHCGESKKEYGILKNREATNFKYGEIVDSGEPSYAEIDGWTVKAAQDPEDPIAVKFEFYCPECSALDAVFDSGDRVSASTD